jgi:hypothetical protein
MYTALSLMLPKKREERENRKERIAMPPHCTLGASKEQKERKADLFVALSLHSLLKHSV